MVMGGRQERSHSVCPREMAGQSALRHQRLPPPDNRTVSREPLRESFSAAETSLQKFPHQPSRNRPEALGKPSKNLNNLLFKKEKTQNRKNGTVVVKDLLRAPTTTTTQVMAP
ncbi:hypothetical protein D9M71_664900 [compost metagenome]